MLKKLSHQTRIISFMLILVLVLSALPLTQAQAATEAEGDGNPRLEKLLQREKTALEKQGERLERTAQVISRTEALIENVKSKGQDASILEEALKTYQDRLVSVRGHHEKAAQILAHPAGFDQSGKVTERKEAFMTLRTAGEELRRFHLEITEAALDLRDAVRSFKEAHKP
jgi:hypothetical protein